MNYNGIYTYLRFWVCSRRTPSFSNSTICFSFLVQNWRDDSDRRVCNTKKRFFFQQIYHILYINNVINNYIDERRTSTDIILGNYPMCVLSNIDTTDIFCVGLPGRIEFLLVFQHLSGRVPDVGFQMIFEDMPMNCVHSPVIGPRHDTRP